MAWRIKWWDRDEEKNHALMRERVEVWVNEERRVMLEEPRDGWKWATLEESAENGPIIRWHHPPQDVELRRGDQRLSAEQIDGQEWSVQAGDTVWFHGQETGMEIVAILAFVEGGVEFFDASHRPEGVDDEMLRSLWTLQRQVALGAGWQNVLRVLGNAAVDWLGMMEAIDGVAVLIWEGEGEFYHRVIWAEDEQANQDLALAAGPQRSGALASLLTRERALLTALKQRDEAVLRTHADGSIDVMLPIKDEQFHGAYYLVGSRGEAFDERGVSTLVDAFKPLGMALMRRYRSDQQVKSLEEENRYFRERERRHYLFKDLVCESSVMRDVYDALHERVDEDSPILMTGEAGTGKELLARAVHHLGERQEGMLIRMGCASFPRELVDFELFGCVASELTGAVAARKGIFELAEGGTVFLDEIDRLSPMVQGKLVRLLKEREVRRIGDAVGRPVDARFIASSHRDLEDLCRRGRFRRDLYELLKAHRMRVPSLRRRPDDILPLARIFLKKFADRYDAQCRSMDGELKRWLINYPWPGNVRQLQTFIEAAVLRVRTQEVVARKDLELEKVNQQVASTGGEG